MIVSELLYLRGFRHFKKMKELKVLESKEVLGNLVLNIYGTFDEPLFLAKDIAVLLEERDGSTVSRKVDEDEKATHEVRTLGGIQSCLCLTEDGLYEALMQSRKPIAKQFKKEVKHILKSIRKNGGYLAPSVDFSDPTIMRNMFDAWEADKRRLEEQKPKVLFAESIETSKQSILIGQLATLIKQNGYDIGQNKLFKWMRENGYLCKGGERYNQPTQRAMDMDLFEVKERTINNPDGSIRITLTTKVTGKGQIYFINIFLK